jgi:hypothetical protein
MDRKTNKRRRKETKIKINRVGRAQQSSISIGMASPFVDMTRQQHQKSK